MSDVQAALGLGQIERLEELVQRKREIFSVVPRRSGQREGPQAQRRSPPACATASGLVTAVYGEASRIDKDALLGKLLERGVDARPFFRPLSSLPAYESLLGVAKMPRAQRGQLRVEPRTRRQPAHGTEHHARSGEVRE